MRYSTKIVGGREGGGGSLPASPLLQPFPILLPEDAATNAASFASFKVEAVEADSLSFLSAASAMPVNLQQIWFKMERWNHDIVNDSSPSAAVDVGPAADDDAEDEVR